jgi:hypothetical protein
MEVENTSAQKLVGYFEQLGLHSEEAQLYLYLLKGGNQTVLAISRGLGTGRTKLYPLLERLADKQLVVVHERHYGTSYEAASPEVVEFLVGERERAASQLRGSLPGMMYMLAGMQQSSPDVSKVIDYRGVDGLKQMNWNLGRAEGEFRVFELAGAHNHLGTHFANKLRYRLYAEKRLKSRDLTNNPEWAVPSPEIPGIVTNSQARYVDPKVFAIRFETFIYNDCVAMLKYDKDDIFGVEIYNPDLAAQQKQLFDLVWGMGSRVG